MSMVRRKRKAALAILTALGMLTLQAQATSVPPAAAPEPPRPRTAEQQQFLEQGRTLCTQNQPIEGARLLAKSAALRPGDKDVAHALHRCYVTTTADFANRDAKMRMAYFVIQGLARDALYDALAIDPDDEELRADLAMLESLSYVTSIDPEEESPVTNDTAEQVGAIPGTSEQEKEFATADALAKAGKFEEALPHAQRAAELASQNDYIQDWYADIEIKAGHYIDAETILRRAITIDSHASNSWMLLGEALLRQDKTDKARKALAQSLACDPYTNQAWLLIDEMQSKAGKPIHEFRLVPKVIYNPRVHDFVTSRSVRDEPLALPSGAPTAHGVWLAFERNRIQLDALPGNTPRLLHYQRELAAWQTTFSAVKTEQPGELGTSDAALNTFYRLYIDGWLDVAVFLFHSDGTYYADIRNGKVSMDRLRILQFIDQTGLSDRLWGK